jgi:hypothetical protein
MEFSFLYLKDQFQKGYLNVGASGLLMVKETTLLSPAIGLTYLAAG